MDDTANLKLPYIIAAQTQKHVTHNEALRMLDAIVQLMVLDKDLSSPPLAPANGDRYIVAQGATGAWAGHEGKLAAYQDGAWAFFEPGVGWLAWVSDETKLYVFDGAAWTVCSSDSSGSGEVSGPVSSTNGNVAVFDGTTGTVLADGGTTLADLAASILSTAQAGLNPAALIGINATADTINRLSINSAASLFNHEGNGHQIKLNKAASGDTGSVLFQTAFAGRAEFGLTGDDDFHVKVSPDGSAWFDAMIIDRASGSVSFPAGGGSGSGGRDVLTTNRTYYVRSDGSDSNTGLANSAAGAFLTLQKAVDAAASLDLGIYDVTIQCSGTTPRTFTSKVALKSTVGAGKVIIIGDETTPSNFTISTTGEDCFLAEGINALYAIRGFKLMTTTNGTAIHVFGKRASVEMQNCEFSAAAVAHMFAESGGFIDVTGNYSISGNAGFAHAVAADIGSLIRAGIANDQAPITITVAGTPALGTTANASRMGMIYYRSGSVTWSGAATGTRYNCSSLGHIQTTSGGANFFPGNAAGVGTTPGVSPYGLYG